MDGMRIISYIVLLRGINVGGHKTIAMADLRALCSDIGLLNVQTLLQSGNLVFKSTEDTASVLEQKLEKAVQKSLGLDIAFFIRTERQWQSAIENNPYIAQAKKDPSHLILTLFKEAPSVEAWAILQSAIKGPENMHCGKHGDDHAYIYYPAGIGNSRLTSALIESKLKTRATARNWNTVLKLADLVATPK
jgi:uncharacterized protein (DUF1697 family)